MHAIEIYAQPATADVAPLNRPTVVLTDRGHAALAVVRLRRQVAGLDHADRAYIHDLLLDLLDDVATA